MVLVLVGSGAENRGKKRGDDRGGEESRGRGDESGGCRENRMRK